MGDRGTADAKGARAGSGAKAGGRRMAPLEPVRFPGKVSRGYVVFCAAADLWLVALTALCIYCAATYWQGTSVPLTVAAFVGVLVLANVIFAFPFIRNYAEFDEAGNIVVAYGPVVDRAEVETVRLVEELRSVRGFLAAGSLDKVRVVAWRMNAMVAVADREGFLAEVARRCPEARIVRIAPEDERRRPFDRR